MKKVFWFVLLVSLPNFCYSSAPHDELKKPEEFALQKNREILGACILYLRTRNTVESTGRKWSQGKIKIISEIDFTTRTLVMSAPGWTFSNSAYTFKYLDDSQLNGLEDTLLSLGKSFNDKSRPALWYDLCKNAGVPEEKWSIPGAMAFLESSKE